MKFLSILSFLFIASGSLNAQVNAELRIYHKLGSAPFQLNITATNNNAQDYEITRLEYYLSRFTVVHDGGQETAIHDDTVALIDAASGPYSSIQLGNINITNVEGVKFHVGVHSPVNNENPSLYAPSHPLAPQSPSMHWGWASGYRFLAYEGMGGVGFSQMFQFHGLFNANYFETSTTATGQTFGSDVVIAVDADYEKGMENIDVDAGLIEHGVDQDDLTALENFRDFVFSSSTETTTADLDVVDGNEWSIYPNPSNGVFFMSFSSDMNLDYVSVVNLLGQEIVSLQLSDLENLSFKLTDSGVYFVNLMEGANVLDTKRILKQ